MMKRDHRIGRNFNNWQGSYEHDERQRNQKQTPGSRNPAQGVLSGNTMLANCTNRDSQVALKAPKKEKKQMKKSTRFKIFGSMRKSVARKKSNDQVASDARLEERQYDEHTLGKRRYVRDVFASDELEYRDKSDMIPTTKFDDNIDFDWNDDDVKFLCKSSEYESDMSVIDPHMYGSRSRSQSTNRSTGVHDPKRKNLIPNPNRSRSNSSSRAISRSQFVHNLEQAERNALSRLADTVNRSRSQSTQRSISNMSRKSFDNQDSIFPHDRSRLQPLNNFNVTMNTRIDSLLNNPSDEISANLSNVVQVHGLQRTHESKNAQSQNSIFDDDQSHVSELSMTSPTEASNKKIMKEMLSISFSDNEIHSKKESNLKKDEKTNISNFFCSLPSMNLPNEIYSDDSSCSTDGSSGPHSNVADLILEGEILPATSSLTSNSTDIAESDNDEDDDETDSSEDEDYVYEKGPAIRGRSFQDAKKILTMIQCKLSDCLVPSQKSPPSLQCKSMFV